MSRKAFLYLWCACVALSVLSGEATKASAADLTVGAFGGIWEQSLRKCSVEPFQKKTGKSVDIVLGAPIQWLNQIAANPAKPPVDVIFNPTETSLDAVNRGLVDKFTPDKVPNMAQLEPKFLEIANGNGAVHNYGTMGLIYNKSTVKEPPKTWKDFYEGVSAGKWKASMPNINYPSAGFTVSVWQLADLYGGGVDNVQPAFDTLKRLVASGNMSFWTDPNQVLNALNSGDVDIAEYWDGRAWAFIDDGHDDFGFSLPSPGGVVALTWIQKVRNSPDLGWSFVDFTMSAEVQSCFGSSIRYGVGNTKAKFDATAAKEITPFSEIVLPPFQDIPSRQSKWLEDWNKQVGR